MFRRIFALIQKPLDIVFLIVAVPAAFVLFSYRRVGSARLPLTTWILKRIGVFPIRNHYYEPLFDDSCLVKPLSDDRELPGIDLNIAGQLRFLSTLKYSSELTEMILDREAVDPHGFCIKNPNFCSGDAEFLYQFIRAVKPRRIIEIGSGHSTRLARIALRNNFSETESMATQTCIEPYEMDWLEKIDGIDVIRKRVEDCKLDWGAELNSGDLLFVDSSHMIRPQGDVLKEYLEIFPQLASGVYIHIHDIFTPKDYLRDWIVKDVCFWNEQYLLEALLSNSQRYEVVSSLNYLMHHHYDELERVCPYLTADREPGSFYIRVR
jgi:hypothetical protein